MHVSGLSLVKNRAGGLPVSITNHIAAWVFAATFWNNYITDKKGYQSRELLGGQVFPGRAYEGDGTNYAYIADNGAIGPYGHDFYICAWIKGGYTHGSAEYIVGRNIATSINGRYGFVVSNSDGHVYVFLQHSDGEISIDTGWKTDDDDDWHFVEMVIDYGVSFKAYFDGSQVGSTTDLSGITVANPSSQYEFTVLSGNNADGSGFSFPSNMAIHDIRCFNTLLSDSERTTIQNGGYIAGAVAWYFCEDTDLYEGFDASGNGYHLTKTSWDTANHVEGPWQSLMNEYGYAVNESSQIIPPDMSTVSNNIPSHDIEGNELTFKGQSKYHGVSKEAACLRGDGVMYLSITGLLTTDTIEVETGSDTPTCTIDGRLDIANGDEVYGITIKRAGVTWAYFPACEGSGIAVYDVSGNGHHATGVNMDETNWSVQDEFHYIRDYGVNASGVPALSDKSAAADGSALTYPQPGYKAIPGTKFQFPENIYELIQADQQYRYGDEISSGNLTVGKRYLITAQDDADFTSDGAPDNNVGTSFVATGTSVTLDSGDKVRQAQEQTGNNLITDGEGSKWRDDNSDGIGNGWNQSQGSGTPSIVTGNGFVGNAQRINHVSGITTRFEYSTGVTAANGQTYKITGKFRAGASNWRNYLRNNLDPFTTNMGANTGNATEFEYTVEATDATEIILRFHKDTAESDDYLEIDEIEVVPVIDSLFYEPEELGQAPVLITVDNLPAIRYLVQYMNKDSDRGGWKDLILLEADSGLGYSDHLKLEKFTKNV